MIIGEGSIIQVYEYFYQKKYNSPKYKFVPSEKASKRIIEFISLIDTAYDINTLGKTFLVNYFIFQFNRTKDQVFNRFASRDKGGAIKVGGRIQIYDIIGKQAFKYWVDRNVQFDFVLYNSDFCKENNIVISEINDLLLQKKGKERILQSEEIEKSRFVNTYRGFLNCIERTSLFDHRSVHCITCRFKQDCKKLLEQNYPHIYQERNYGVPAN